MADTKTVNEWKLAAEQSQLKLSELKNKVVNVDALIFTVNQTINDAIDLRNRALARAIELEKNSPNITADIVRARNNIRITEQQIEQLKSQKARLEVYKQEDSARVTELEDSISYANRQAEIAADTPLGPAGTNPLSENTPPVTPDTDPFEAARLQALATASEAGPTSQAVIDAIDDDILRQYAQNRAEAEAQDEAARNTASMAAAEFGLQNVSAGTNAARNSGGTYQTEIPKIKDWRFRISIASNTNYLYNSPTPGILSPLKATNGVIFPYTPNISVTYAANYEPGDLAHSNYKNYTYRNSSVENISITGEFTAQDTTEANYLLSVIHFFRSATKMFYGKDVGPIRGIPPPLCYLNGHGDYAFNKHAVVITSFTLIYPPDVDYIIARPPPNTSNTIPGTTGDSRLINNRLAPGGLTKQPQWATDSTTELGTRIPTRMQIQLQCLPIVSRKNVSNNFSLEKYASGELLLGNKNISGGFW
jgi:hypothetical protein